MTSTEKERQIAYYDNDVREPEFEISRPHGESRLYQYVMNFKIARVIGLLGRPVRGSSVLAVCCGSGMDAEYLARCGADVTALDISPGCLRRAQTRALRYGVRYALVRGDAEHLPFADNSFDFAFVHDGLHHLEQPNRAVCEMTRVARLAVMVSEPALATVTSLPTRLGLMNPREEAGNYINRASPQELSQTCRALGFTAVRWTRYLLKYGHPPAAWWRLFDREPLFSFARVAFLVFGVHLGGRWGNKLAFVAEKDA
jgi:SAM-dependent methyltransferase